MDTWTAIDERAEPIKNLPIRELVELYPETMTILSLYGLDLCCGGAHTVAEAAELHGHDPASVVRQVALTIDRARS